MCSFEEPPDALAAYRHFLFGKEKDRIVDYERYLQNDKSAKTLLHDLIGDVQYHADVIGEDRMMFEVTSTEYRIGGPYPFAPYAATINWGRAIGGHVLWLSGRVRVSADGASQIVFKADVTIYMEDRFNFNCDQADMSTGIPDEENGLFEITGLAHQYTSYATVTRSSTWIKRAAREAESHRRRSGQPEHDA